MTAYERTCEEPTLLFLKYEHMVTATHLYDIRQTPFHAMKTNKGRKNGGRSGCMMKWFEKVSLPRDLDRASSTQVSLSSLGYIKTDLSEKIFNTSSTDAI